MNTKVRAILGIATVGMLLYTAYVQDSTITKYKKVIRDHSVKDSIVVSKVDSIQDELFQARTAEARYEIALELLNERDPKAGKEFKHILESETE